MKKIIILFILISGVVFADDLNDTLESGSSDSIKVIPISKPAKLVIIQFKQLDTNGVTSPDSVVLYNQKGGIVAPVDFNLSIGDTNRTIVNYTYGSHPLISSSSTGEVRTGWVWLASVTSLYIRMFNSVYRTNRKILYDVTIIYN